MYGSFGGWQSGEDHRETVKKLYEGRQARARAGYVVPQGIPPLGFAKIRGNDKRCRFEIIEVEAEIVRSIFRWYVVDGLSLLGIAHRLDEMGIKTRHGGLWRQHTIRQIITNTAYYGVWYFSKDENRRPTAESIPVPVPAIIDRELWEMAQLRLTENRANSKRNRTPGRYLMANRVTCGDCGYKMHGMFTTTKTKNKVYEYLFYSCRNSSKTSSGEKYKECNLPYFNAGIVDAKVWQWLEKIANDRDKLQAGLEDYNNGQQSKLEPIRRELALVEATLKDKNQEWEEETDNLRFLTSDRAKAKKGAEIAALEAVIKSLEAEKTKLLSQLEVSTFAPEQHAIGITAFMGEVAQKIAKLHEMEAQGVDLPELKMAVYEGKRAMLAWLDVQVKLFIEDGKKKAEVKAKVCPQGDVLLITPTSS